MDPRRPFQWSGARDVKRSGPAGSKYVAQPRRSSRRGFNMMDLPAELRLKIYPYLLVCDEAVPVNYPKGIVSLIPGPSHSTGSYSSTSLPSSPLEPPSTPEIPPRPSVAILQTCKLINEEATPILYRQNKFINYLTMEPSSTSSLSNTFLLRHLRWSSIWQLKSLSFSSDSNALPGIDEGIPGVPPRSRPTFHCTGADIMRRFTIHDMRYSPKGPDEYMALSLSNWVSTQVMRVMLSAFQKELEEMMRPSGMFYGAGIAIGTGTGTGAGAGAGAGAGTVATTGVGAGTTSVGDDADDADDTDSANESDTHNAANQDLHGV